MSDVRRVLLVEDEASLRLLCRVNLELEGHSVLEADTVEAARGLLGAAQVDVVLLDLHLGAESGLDVLDTVDALDLPVRVVLISGDSDISQQVRARVADVVPKPFDLERLSAAVRGGASGKVSGA